MTGSLGGDDAERCPDCGGVCEWEGNMTTCLGCGMVGLHYEGSLPAIIDAIDAACSGLTA